MVTTDRVGFWEKGNLMGIFREYDIRGIVEQDLAPEVVEQIGRAYATLARARGVRTHHGGTGWPFKLVSASQSSCGRLDRCRNQCGRSWSVRDPLAVFLTVFL